MTEPKQYPQGFAREREREIIRYKKRVDRLVHDLWLCRSEERRVGKECRL